MHARRASTVATAVLALAVSASARADLVPCGQRDKATGMPKEGTAIHLRSACRPNEVRVSPTALGAQSGVWRDATGVAVGSYDAGALLTHLPSGDAIVVAMGSQGELAGGELWFAAANCGGPPLTQGSPTLPVQSVAARAGVVYYATGTRTTTAVLSHMFVGSSFTSQAACDSIQGPGFWTFAPPEGCCRANSNPSLGVNPTATFDLSGFTAPFHVDVE